MLFLIKLANLIDAITLWAGRVAAILILVLIALIFYNVFGRYAIGNSSVALQESEWHLLAPIAMLGIVVLMKENGHVRVDMIYENLSRSKQLLIDLFSMLVGVMVSIFMIKYSIGFVESSFQTLEGSADPGGLPGRYLLKAIIPAGFVLFALQCLANAIRHLDELIMPEANHDH